MSVVFRRSIQISTTALLALLLVLAACTTVTNSTTTTVTGSGTPLTEERTVGGFSKFDLRTIGGVNVTIGETDTLSISGDSNIVPLITVYVQNGWLVIEGPANTSLQPTLPVIYTVTMRGLSDMTLSGSGTITVNDLSAESLETTVSGSGSIVVTGTIDRQQVTISGAGAYDASKVDGTDAGVTVSGMGNARLNVSGTLDATISGAGNIMYSGGATVTQNITGAGQVVGE
ncbi:MAG: DUF2807 domain-containing protein [Chloroflexi bacterium]|nr:DUF2807 domain-containing protein [Chloroflexota bacterium]